MAVVVVDVVVVVGGGGGGGGFGVDGFVVAFGVLLVVLVL